MTAYLKVIAPGLGASLQDLGRVGYQALGVPPSGALDPVMLRVANWLADNDGDLGAIEMRFSGPAFEVMGKPVRLATAGEGAGLILQPSGERIPGYRSATLSAGERFRVALTGGAACYLAVAGGFDVGPMLGSVATLTVAGLGGFAGRSLIAGDILPIKRPAGTGAEHFLRPLSVGPPGRLRVILGPQRDYFPEDTIRQFLGGAFAVSPRSDRMGLRLEGEALLHAKGADIISDGNVTGSIQVPGSGQPIILLADRGTTGGYPKIATVITADLPLLGRLTPGLSVRFQMVSHDQAVAALRAHLAWLQELRCSIRPFHDSDESLMQALAEENIVSGVTDGVTLGDDD
jgi:biotin-dependent carboxylase-like uncharacterized protein